MSGLRPMPQFAEGEAATQTDLADPGFAVHMYNSAQQALMDGPVSGVQDYFELRRLKADEDDALLGTQVLKNQYGVNSSKPMRRGAAQFIRNRNERRANAQGHLDAGKKGFTRGASSFAASLLGSALDPVNLGSMFIPLGPLTLGKNGKKLLGGIAPNLKGHIGLRTGNRFVQKAAFGAAEGAVGFAPVEAVVAFSEINLQSGYDYTDALTALAMDVGLGAGIHTSIEGFSALMGRGPDGSFGIPPEGLDDIALAAGADLLAGPPKTGMTRAQRMTLFHLNNVMERAGAALEDQSGRKARRKLRNKAKRKRRGIEERRTVDGMDATNIQDRMAIMEGLRINARAQAELAKAPRSEAVGGFDVSTPEKRAAVLNDLKKQNAQLLKRQEKLSGGGDADLGRGQGQMRRPQNYQGRDPVAEAKELGKVEELSDPPQAVKPPEMDEAPSPQNIDELKQVQEWVDELEHNTIPETMDSLPPEVRLELNDADAGLNAVRTLRKPENFKILMECILKVNQTVIS